MCVTGTGSAALVLRLAEHDLLRLLVHRTGAPLVGHELEAALYRGARLDRVEPAMEVREVLELLSLPLVGADPRIGRDVGDRIVAGEVLDLAETPVDDVVETPRLVGVAVDRVLDLLG